MGNRYVSWRIVSGIALAVGGLVFAFLWDPTQCISPALKCAGSAYCRHPPVYCTHLYVALREGVAVVSALIGLALLWLALSERRRAAS